MSLSTTQEGLAFDDVLLRPRYSDILSRKDVSLVSRLTKKRWLSSPIISANMDTVTEFHMAAAMSDCGGLGIIHRFLSITDMNRICQWMQAYTKTNIAVAIGVNSTDTWPRVWGAIENGATILCIDVAHGHHKRVIDLIKKLKDDPRIVENGIDIIAGNVSTFDGAYALMEAGADAIKVGVGPGSMCSTRIRTGHGVPQLSAIANCKDAVNNDCPIIADGGIRNSGDIVKALAAGADTVMIGSLFAGTEETPGVVLDGHKIYRGMASREAQMDWKGEVSVVEGEAVRIPLRGPVGPIVQELLDGVRSGFSYSGAMSISELREKAVFVKVTQAGQVESKPHGLL